MKKHVGRAGALPALPVELLDARQFEQTDLQRRFKHRDGMAVLHKLLQFGALAHAVDGQGVAAGCDARVWRRQALVNHPGDQFAEFLHPFRHDRAISHIGRRNQNLRVAGFAVRQPLEQRKIVEVGRNHMPGLFAGRLTGMRAVGIGLTDDRHHEGQRGQRPDGRRQLFERLRQQLVVVTVRRIEPAAQLGRLETADAHGVAIRRVEQCGIERTLYAEVLLVLLPGFAAAARHQPGAPQLLVANLGDHAFEQRARSRRAAVLVYRIDEDRQRFIVLFKKFGQLRKRLPAVADSCDHLAGQRIAKRSCLEPAAGQKNRQPAGAQLRQIVVHQQIRFAGA